MKVFVLIILYTILFNYKIQAQQTFSYPEMHSVYFYNLPAIHPGYIYSNYSKELQASYKFRTDEFEELATFSFMAAAALKQKKSTLHVGRVLLSNDKEGPYINTPRAYLNYAGRLRIGDSTFLFSGFTMGVVSSNFSASSANGNSVAPDGSLGFGLSYKNLSAGASSFQIFNNSNSPISAILLLKRYYQLFCTGEKKINAHWVAHGFYFWRVLPGKIDEMNFTLLGEWSRTIRIGAVYRNNFGTSFLGSAIVKQGKNKLLISFVYNSGLLLFKSKNFDSMEISLGYSIF